MAEAAAYGIGEEEVWNCPKHPSRRRRNGICATCLRERLVILCPQCAQVRPCPCVYNSTSSSSSSGSSSSSSSVRRVSSLRYGESLLPRSRSVAIPFLRSSNNEYRTSNRSSKTPSLLSVFKRSNTKRSQPVNEKCYDFMIREGNEEINSESNHRIEDFAKMITRSRSVSTGSKSGLRGADVNSGASTAKFWRLPMKIFRS